MKAFYLICFVVTLCLSLVAAINVDELKKRLKVAKKVDKMIPILIDNLNSTDEETQSTAAEFLAEIARETPAKAKVAIEPLVQLSESENIVVACSALAALARFMVPYKELRDRMLEKGVIEQIYNFIEQDPPVEAFRNMAFTSMVLSSHYNKVPLPKKDVEKLLPALKLFLHHDDGDVQYSAAGAFLTLIECRNQMDFDYGFVDEELIIDLIKLLKHKDIKVQAYVIEIFRNLAFYLEHAELMFENEILKTMPKLLMTSHGQVTLDALFIISNIAAISKEHSKIVWDSNLVPLIVNHLSEPSNQKEHIQASLAVQTLAEHCTPKQALYLLNQDIVENICRILFEAEKGDFLPLRNKFLQAMAFVLNNLKDQEKFFERLNKTKCKKIFNDVVKPVHHTEF